MVCVLEEIEYVSVICVVSSDDYFSNTGYRLWHNCNADHCFPYADKTYHETEGFTEYAPVELHHIILFT